LVLGLPLGVIVARHAWGLVESRLGIESAVVVPTGWVVVVAASTLVVAQLTSLVPGRRASRIRAAEALRAD
jgi:ABC-type lipoprotein release transport system permease subunit